MSKFPRDFIIDRRAIVGRGASVVGASTFGVHRLVEWLSIGNTGEGTLADFITRWRRLDQELCRSIEELVRAEESALARGVHWDDCPNIAAIRERDLERSEAMKRLIYNAARTRAASLDQIVLKLVFWRLADLEADGFDNPNDTLSFSAYCDLLALTGNEALAHPADEKARAALWGEDLFADRRSYDEFAGE